ncbi:malate dehydrogenase [Methylacidimicrobium cyclopophantes]|uniref:Malate dehydrogenase n=1 Tax=Methylacidimicrobium cyclopophantes TaxID=1041766 RepID=A0A5E6MHD5_9BACT|nr:malate dehydrogenase [Methylacidimicrobium cyclopophantes]VVM07723.1 malate dehydrogenase [Methylacidimicrobium cyclopophantes]
MKIAVIGAGFVGATTAQRLVERNLGDLVLYDIVEGLPQGKALDMMESAPIWGFESRVVGSNDPKDLSGSEIIIITSGIARQPGMSRDDLLERNAGIVASVADQIRQHASQAMVIVVTNPVDVLTHLAAVKIGTRKERIFGLGGILDAGRFRHFIASELGVAHADVDAMVLGGHGDDMVPLPRFATVNGVSIETLLPAETIQKLVARTREGGAEIVRYLKKGSAYYAPSAAIAQMVESVVRDQKRLLPCSVWCSGQYGITGQFVGLPVILGRSGVERIVELPLNAAELKELQRSSAHVAATTAKLQIGG